MLSAEPQVDVILGLRKNIGLTNIEVSSSVRFWAHNLLGTAFQPGEPKDTFDGSAQDNTPCEVDSNEGLVDGRVEGRTGVHVEGEAVLKSERNNNEGACEMLCQM